MNLILATLLLCGPPAPHERATIPLSIHLGRDAKSAVARSELANVHPFFSHRRFVIQTHYRLTVDEDEFAMPTFQLGSGDVRHSFPAGAFSSSGSFILTVSSICAVDRWERADFIPRAKYGEFNETQYFRDESDKPEVFP